MHPVRIIVFFSALILCLSACKDEPGHAAVDQELLNGRWEIDEAWRNGKQTGTLAGAYYEFQNGTMRTNLTPTLIEDEFPYDLSKNEIRQKSEPPVVYTIQSLSDSMLVMTLSINTFPFRLQLKKAGPANGNATEANDTL